MPPLIRRHRMVDKLRTAVALSVAFVLIFAGDAPASDRCETGLPLLFQAKQRDLKNGYAIYREEYRAPAGHWEGRIHYDCLHHQGVALGVVGTVSVSPSGQFILYNEAPTGWWVLADGAGNQKLVGSVDRSFKYFGAIVWNEAGGEVLVTYTDGSEPARFRLNELSNKPVQPTPHGGAADRPRSALTAAIGGDR